jgi:hypothetical protein
MRWWTRNESLWKLCDGEDLQGTCWQWVLLALNVRVDGLCAAALVLGCWCTDQLWRQAKAGMLR